MAIRLHPTVSKEIETFFEVGFKVNAFRTTDSKIEFSIVDPDGNKWGMLYTLNTSTEAVATDKFSNRVVDFSCEDEKFYGELLRRLERVEKKYRILHASPRLEDASSVEDIKTWIDEV